MIKRGKGAFILSSRDPTTEFKSIVLRNPFGKKLSAVISVNENRKLRLHKSHKSVKEEIQHPSVAKVETSQIINNSSASAL